MSSFCVILCKIFLAAFANSGKSNEDEKPNTLTLVAAGSGGGLLFVVTLVSILFFVRRYRLKTGNGNGPVSMENMPNSDFFDGLTAASTNHEYQEDNPLYNSKTVQLDDLKVEKISRDRLRYIEPLAEGAFGKVSSL